MERPVAVQACVPPRPIANCRLDLPVPRLHSRREAAKVLNVVANIAIMAEPAREHYRGCTGQPTGQAAKCSRSKPSLVPLDLLTAVNHPAAAPCDVRDAEEGWRDEKSHELRKEEFANDASHTPPYMDRRRPRNRRLGV
ncbi:Hypp4943 [Branchiostoma lanceolatum]|uniref:Hypp4943 protein n=1 Tax=Branchiostoma lanceolatum TaxID=7740 RepID=A0A8K0AHJ2_BRALA|nr:Hypp4943 [Branchiostoma lanceolatum]